MFAWRADGKLKRVFSSRDEHGETVTIGTQTQPVALQFVKASMFLIFNDLFLCTRVVPRGMKQLLKVILCLSRNDFFRSLQWFFAQSKNEIENGLRYGLFAKQYDDTTCLVTYIILRKPRCDGVYLIKFN